MLHDTLISKIDKVASSLESKGFIKEAEMLDVVANTLEKEAGFGNITVRQPDPYSKMLDGAKFIGNDGTTEFLEDGSTEPSNGNQKGATGTGEFLQKAEKTYIRTHNGVLLKADTFKGRVEPETGNSITLSGDGNKKFISDLADSKGKKENPDTRIFEDSVKDLRKSEGPWIKGYLKDGNKPISIAEWCDAHSCSTTQEGTNRYEIVVLKNDFPHLKEYQFDTSGSYINCDVTLKVLDKLITDNGGVTTSKKP